MRPSAESILAISLRWRSRALQLDGAIGLGRRAVGEVGVILVFVLQVLKGLARLAQDLFLPCQQLLAEILALAFVHELFGIGWTVLVNARTRHAMTLVICCNARGI